MSKSSATNAKTTLPSAGEIFTPLPDERSGQKKSKLKFHEAIHLIEAGYEDTSERRGDVRLALETHLDEATDLEEKATALYYLLRLLLDEHLLFENQRAQGFYEQMFTAFLNCEDDYRSRLRQAKNVTEKKIARMQFQAFYQIMDRHLVSLELVYGQKGFLQAEERVHENKMRFRRRFARFAGRHFLHLGHLFLDHSSRYGHSFLRWGATTILFIALFAGVYAALDFFSETSMFERIADSANPFNYFYFSLVTFTTVGYGDITPLTNLEKLFAGLEALLGYVMLGMFIVLIQKRF